MNFSSDDSDITVSSLSNLPKDTISSISWKNQENNYEFVVGSWDSNIRLYKIDEDENRKSLNLVQTMALDSPSLSTSWNHDETKIYTGTIGNSLKVIDLNTGKSAIIGENDIPIKNIYSMPNPNEILSVSLGRTIKLWDLRMEKPASEYQLKNEIICSDILYPILALALCGEMVAAIDISSMQILEKQNIHYNDSFLDKGNILTSICVMQNKTDIAIGNHEGRVCFHQLSVQPSGCISTSKNYSYKCHREGGVIYPVNMIGTNPRHKAYLFTAGGDGTISHWDYLQKMRTKQYTYNKGPVTHAKTSSDGKYLAYSLGYDWCRGIDGYMSYTTKLFVHTLENNDIFYKKI